MAPIAAERMPLEPVGGELSSDWMKGQGCGELGAPCYCLVEQLGWQAGRPATVLPSTLFCFGNFMKKKGKAEQLGEG